VESGFCAHGSTLVSNKCLAAKSLLSYSNLAEVLQPG
jgi:hypothetical protein